MSNFHEDGIPKLEAFGINTHDTLLGAMKLLSRQLVDARARIKAMEAEGREVTLYGEQIIGMFRFEPGRYLILKLDGPAPEPAF